ncbi:hypothetical protein [Pantanalinema sp. GBBB05]|uniref:hypothetical protein n=1 Tax=Pantanalinema sp. GBBB05 TaxID=2604139 RepID=UPI001D32D16E|nr:hypothetical protein [Pantanalinema sp. GBBB05]
MSKQKRVRRWLSVMVAIALCTIGGFTITEHQANSPAIAQVIPRVRPDGVWQQIYQRVPTLPLENQYVSKETKKVATDNTLVGRFIRYHLYSKGRLPFYRLDWKISLADYLGVNERMDETDYPSRDTLNQNPMEADIVAIRGLTRAQRDALVQALVDAFTASSSTPTTPTQP